MSIKATKDGQGDDEEEDEEPRRKRGRGVNRTEKQPKDDDSVQRDSDGFEERVLQVWEDSCRTLYLASTCM